jgi:hypothetical protein
MVQKWFGIPLGMVPRGLLRFLVPGHKSSSPRPGLRNLATRQVWHGYYEG